MTRCSVHRLMGALLVASLAVCLAPTAEAQQARLGLYFDTKGNDCHIPTFDSSPVVVTIVVTNAFPFSGVGFRAPVPAGVTWVSEGFSPGFTVLTGDTQKGVIVTTTCVSSTPIVIGDILVIAPNSLPPTSWEISGYWGAKVDLYDCSEKDMYGKSSTAWFNNPRANCSRFQYLAPYFPLPQGNSAPINSKLSFIGDANHLWLSTEPFDTPRDEDLVCVTARGGSCPNPFDPGLLQPYTTYYWMAGNVCDPPSEDCEDALSDMWTFTTGDGTVAVQSSTWGSIKALYR